MGPFKYSGFFFFHKKANGHKSLDKGVMVIGYQLSAPLFYM